MDGSLALLPAHLLFAYVVLGEPWLGILFYRRLRARLAVDPLARAGYYKLLLTWERAWLPAIGLALWAAGAGPDAVGLRPLNNDGWIIAGAVLLSVALSTLVILRSSQAQASIRRQAAAVQALLPANGRERWLFAAVSITAGICEELLYRGFLGWYLTAVFPSLSLLVVGVLSGLIFGLAHAYQGRANILTTGAFGAAMYAVYWYGGSLLPAMLAHALSDLRAIVLVPARGEPPST